MEIDVTFTPNELGKTSREGRVVVVIDVVRAATTMCTGLANGAAAFLPVRSVTAARRRAQAIPEGQRLLGGERGGVPPAGFDLGNSPLDYTPERVAGQQIVFTTTNGTATLAASWGCAGGVHGRAGQPGSSSAAAHTTQRAGNAGGRRRQRPSGAG